MRRSLSGLQAVPSIPPLPAQVRSERLAAQIRLEIEAAGGLIGFDRFMELALYAPEFGYYSSGTVRFGVQGDFTTAAESAPWYARCLARQCAEVLEILPGGEILELGAGSGTLACALLKELAELDRLPARYRILEISPALRERQERCTAELPESCRARIEWLEAPPDRPWQGLILASEVADALPVHRLCLRGGRWRELGVGSDGRNFVWIEADQPLQAQLAPLVQRVLEAADGLEEGYITELNAALEPWLCSAAGQLQRGLMLCIDYGYPRAEYLHPQRCMGTLLCHRDRRVHDDPLRSVGLQDITAFVDFTLLAEAGRGCGLEVYGYTNQAGFLLGCCGPRTGAETDAGTGAGTGAGTDAGAGAILAATGAEARWLLLPTEMGERYRVMALGRDLGENWKGRLSGFRLHDHRHRL